MIRQRESIETLAADPDVQRAIARVPRAGRPLPAEPYKVRIKEIAPRLANAETTLAAAHAKIDRLEHELGVCQRDIGSLAKMILKSPGARRLNEEELMFALRKERQS